MDKKLFIIAGCNGAGKTTAFRRMLSSQLGDPIFVNPDVIARNIDDSHQWEARISAGRETLLQIDSNIDRGVSFCVETTLTSKSYTQIIKRAHDNGYQVNLYYYWLESADASYRRVLQRVEEGRHDSSVDNHMIPEDIIRRRYPKSINNLLHVFIPIVDFWEVYDNNLGLALPIASKNKVYDSFVWDAIQRNDPNEVITCVNIDRLVDTIGIRHFSETVLRDKLNRNESVIYSIDGKVETFSPEDILWLYENFNRNLDNWEIEHLRVLAAKGEEQYYSNGKHFPASMVLKLYGKL
jgi:predicted ABC-type ATPase